MSSCNQNVLQNDPYVELYRLQSQKYSADIVGRNYNLISGGEKNPAFVFKHLNEGPTFESLVSES